MDSTIPPTIAIVGPTASGKTALAIEIAQRHGGEIICVDSRTIFREMDVGTAKPTREERAAVPHWGLDLVDPGQRYTAAAFQRYAQDKIAEIRRRGHVPILVGGTGLYIDGILFDYQYPAEPTVEQRRRLEAMGAEELYRYCIENNVELPINDKNKRHLVRSIIHQGSPDKRRHHVRPDMRVYGIAVERSTLRTRIAKRTEQMFNDGVVEEAKMLGKKYGWNSEGMNGNIYPLLREYLSGQTDLERAKNAIITRDRQLAKRQMTWFRRNQDITWGEAADIARRVKAVLASGYNL